MDFITALNVTIYGLGIVFLALLVVMFVIILLSRIFSATTGKDFLAAPTVSEENPSEGGEAAPPPATGIRPWVKPMPSTANTLPPPIAARRVPQPAASSDRVTAPLPGKVLSIAVKAGQSLSTGDDLCVIEAMKMANTIKAHRDCTIQEVLVTVGDSVPFGAPLFEIQ